MIFKKVLIATIFSTKQIILSLDNSYLNTSNINILDLQVTCKFLVINFISIFIDTFRNLFPYLARNLLILV